MAWLDGIMNNENTVILSVNTLQLMFDISD